MSAARLSRVIAAHAPGDRGVTGMAVFFQMIQNINVGGRINKSQYQYTLQSSDTDTLYKLAPEMRDKIAKMPACSTSPPISTSPIRRS